MAVVDYGFPNRVFFELYAGEHPSEKIYSVQVKDWVESAGDSTAAVVQVDLDQIMTNHESHMQVEPTADLVAFMDSRGITLPDTIYVQPLAFAWSRDGEFEVEEEMVEPQPDGGKEKGSKTKAIWAALVAVLAALN